MTDDANQRGAEKGRDRPHFLAEWREYRGYKSQRDLAKAMGVDHTKISRIEKDGKDGTELRPGFAQRLARFLHIPLAALYATNPLGEGKEDAEMFDIWAEIAAEDRPAALRMLRSLRRAHGQRESG